jgi:branched-chain amino acid aminotransferase
MGIFASVNGNVVPAEQARVSVLDNGFTFGDAVYETLRTYRGRPFHLDRHLERLRASAGRLGFAAPFGDEVFARRLDELLARAGNEESYIRIILSRGEGDISYRFDRVTGPTLVMVVKPFEPPPERDYAEGIPIVIASVRRNHPRALDPAIKSNNLLNNILAVREGQGRGAAEAILLNDLGEVAEGASSNVFVVKGGRVSTPPLDTGILSGITRRIVLDLCRELGIPAREETLIAADLFAADEVFITSTTKEAVPVRTIDGKQVGTGRPGPIQPRILQAYRDYALRSVSR